MDSKIQSVFSKIVKAGKKRTYFFDVRSTKGNDYFVTITESRKKLDGEGYDKNKIFLYKEDFNKFLEAMQQTIGHVKTELLPDFDFANFDRDEYEANQDRQKKHGHEDRAYEGSPLNAAAVGAERLDTQPNQEDAANSTFLTEENEKW